MNISIVCVEQVDPAGAIRSIERTCALVPYKCEKVLVTPHRISVPPDIRLIQMDDFGRNWKEWWWQYAFWMVRTLPTMIDADYVINVQPDGYAVNGDAWTDEFLDYDYIGAPWPIWFCLVFNRGHAIRRVGSTGFGLRSRKWLDAQLTSPQFNGWAEDWFCSVRYARHFTKLGCKIAPVKLALKWCTEFWLEDYPFWQSSQSFGQHGLATDRKTRMYHMSPPRAFLDTIKRSWKNRMAKPASHEGAIITMKDSVRHEVIASMNGAVIEAEAGWSSYDCGPAVILSLKKKLEAPGIKLSLDAREAKWLAEHLRSCEESLDHPGDRPRAYGRIANSLIKI